VNASEVMHPTTQDLISKIVIARRFTLVRNTRTYGFLQTRPHGSPAAPRTGRTGAARWTPSRSLHRRGTDERGPLGPQFDLISETAKAALAGGEPVTLWIPRLRSWWASSRKAGGNGRRERAVEVVSMYSFSSRPRRRAGRCPSAEVRRGPVWLYWRTLLPPYPTAITTSPPTAAAWLRKCPRLSTFRIEPASPGGGHRQPSLRP
jgi:hypothetical protein